MRAALAAAALLLLAGSAHAQKWQIDPPFSAGNLPAQPGGTPAAAGAVGEFFSAQAGGATSAVTISSGTPAVVTWTGQTFGTRCVSASAANRCALPVLFTGLVGTSGVANNTVYYVDPASLTANSFRIATSVANALAGTDVATTGTDAGTGDPEAYVTSSSVGEAVIGASLSPGDWDCTGGLYETGVASTSVTTFALDVAAGVGGIQTGAGSAQNLNVVFATGPITNNLVAGTRRFLNAAPTTISLSIFLGWTGGTTNPVSGGLLRCRRVQ